MFPHDPCHIICHRESTCWQTVVNRNPSSRKQIMKIHIPAFVAMAALTAVTAFGQYRQQAPQQSTGAAASAGTSVSTGARRLNRHHSINSHIKTGGLRLFKPALCGLRKVHNPCKAITIPWLKAAVAIVATAPAVINIAIAIVNAEPIAEGNVAAGGVVLAVAPRTAGRATSFSRDGGGETSATTTTLAAQTICFDLRRCSNFQ